MPSAARRIASHLFVYGSADAAILFVNFLLLPVYTRVLSAPELGALALLGLFEAFLKLTYRWGLDQSYLRLYYDCGSDRDRRTLAGTIAAFMAVANGAILVLLIVAAPVVANALIGTPEHTLAFQLMVVNGFVAGFLFLPLTLLRIQEKSTQFATITFARSFGVVVARLILVVGVRLGVLGIMLADVIVSVLAMVALAPQFRSMMTVRFSWPTARAALRYGLPRVPHGLLHQVMGLSDRFFLGLYLPLRDVGVYLIASSIASVLKLYPVAFTAAWMPFAFESLRRPDAPRMFARLGSYAFAVLVFLTLAMALTAEPLVRLMTPATFHDAVPLIVVLAMGIAFQSMATFLTTSFNIAKRSRALPIATSVAALVTVGAHLVLIPRWGLPGAAWAVVLGQVALTATMGFFAQRSYHIPYEWGRLGKAAVLGGGLYLIASTVAAGWGLWPVVGRVLLLAAFPFGLIAARFFRPNEAAEVWRLVATLTPGAVARQSPTAAPD